MTSKQSCLTIPEWVEKDIIGETDNKSGRVVELIIKGYMAEKEKALNSKSQLSATNAPIVYSETYFSEVLRGVAYV